MPTPAKPTTMPTTASHGSRSPRRIRPKIAIQTGMSAMSRAVIPDGMVCSPKATMPIPPPSSSAPTTVVSRHSRRVGATNPVRAPQADPGEQDGAGQQEPGAAMRNGGMVSTATAMARYVEPHTT